MWFFLDEWDFLANRTGCNLARPVRGAQRALGDAARSSCTAGMWCVFGLNSYRPYQLLIVLAAPRRARCSSRTVMRRVGVRPWTATIVAAVFVFFGSGYQNIVLPFQMTLVGSLVFGLVHLLLATHDGDRWRPARLARARGRAGRAHVLRRRRVDGGRGRRRGADRARLAARAAAHRPARAPPTSCGTRPSATTVTTATTRSPGEVSASSV